ncbi:general odorant-binding protein 83a-like [Anopheles marshallii]|uniref:general odorant-binding protein 83a-like n=1 Tax=Anopheles marshallii TaxID=1521116 RepID=UPI00237A6471|nr:general odorant-binding protein 83a-like [Anopheles marshallii]
MLLRLLLGLLCLFALGSSETQRPVPRRDAKYPPPETLAFLKPHGEQCEKETGVTRAAIKRFSDEDIFEDDRALKCYMDCMFRVTNVTDDRGELHMLKLLEYVPPEFEDIALRMGVRCTRPKGKDVCERAFWFHKCWKISNPVYYYLA